MTDDEAELGYDADGSSGVLTLTLRRPEHMSTLTRSLIAQLISAFDAADQDDDVRVIVVTGSGPAFCAGTDLRGGGGTFDTGRQPGRAGNAPPPEPGGPLAMRIYRCRKPVIGAINGVAVGVGATMTLLMDVRLAAETAKFGFIFNRRGITADACSSWFLPRIVGISRALEWVATGRVFPAGEAAEAGLVRSVHPPHELLDTARALAAEMADGTAPVSVAISRRMLWRMLACDDPAEAHRIESIAIASRGASPDAGEGVRAFLEKRPADFPLRVSSDLPEWFIEWDAPSRGFDRSRPDD